MFINKTVKCETGISRINRVRNLVEKDEIYVVEEKKEPKPFAWDECEVLI